MQEDGLVCLNLSQPQVAAGQGPDLILPLGRGSEMAFGNLHLDLGQSIILRIEMVPSPECLVCVPSPECPPRMPNPEL